MLSASFHSGARQGSLTGKGHRSDAAEMMNMATNQVALDQLKFQKDENNRLTLTIEFTKEKQDQGNRCYRRPFHFSPLSDGSPYDAAVLAFLFLSVRGAFALSPIEAYNKGDFSLREEARSWPLLCHVDNSSGKINNNKPLNDLTSLFKRVVVKAGFDPRRITHHCNRSRFATTFIINQMVENNGVFPREAISTLCRLAGWSEKGGTWALYIKEVMERHLDTSAYIYRDLRTDKTAYLKAIKTSYNYRLVQPEKILVSREDCMQCDETSFLRFEDSFSDEVLKTTIGEASEGQIACGTVRASLPKSMDRKQSITQLNRPSQVLTAEGNFFYKEVIAFWPSVN
ncbi:unnamed protein product [Porites lobata]|uniref:Uncharacterized protein n=1 Tax=Porites lobata TaxID=104759 RepID=A0ABN8NVD9_9CNID|nr:unnamed protein product [Porites lobata]